MSHPLRLVCVSGTHRCRLGESPAWDVESGTLLYVDIPGGIVHRLDPRTGSLSEHAFDDPVGGAAPAGRGALLLGRGRVLCLAQVREGDWEIDSLASAPTGDRINDIKVDPCGRVLVGTMRNDFQPGYCGLYRLGPEREGFVEVLDGVGLSNGFDWSVDGSTLYHVDTLAGSIHSYDYDLSTGHASGRAELVSAARLGGRPDGLTVDHAGGIWVALIGAGEIRRYMPDGQLDLAIRVPTSRPTSMAFGGIDLETLYVTTAVERTGTSGGLDGALFAVSPGRSGRPPTLPRFTLS